MAMAWSWVRVSCLVLLFSGCLAAVVNKETPEALVAPEEITATPLTLKSFTWNAAAKEAGRGAGYESLKVCYEEPTPENLAALRALVDVYTLVYTNEFGILVEFDIGVAGTGPNKECVTFTKESGEITLLPGNVTYQLHIASADGATQKWGVATFEIDLAQYKMPDVVCGGISYTRTSVEKPKDCLDAGGISASDAICYTPAADGEGGLDTDGCITNAGVLVCLSDMAGMEGPLSDGTIAVNSLAYPAPSATVATLNIVYGKGNTAAAVTTVESVEFLMQDSSDPTLFYAGACVDATGVSCPTTADYTQQVKTYQVCAVGFDDGDVVISYTPQYEITDLNLAVFDNGDQLEFGFRNSNPGDQANPEGKLYYASVATAAVPGTELVNVGIDCKGVAPEHTCYGFLTASDPGAYNIKVGYGALNGEIMELVSNTIIAPHTKKTQEPQE